MKGARKALSLSYHSQLALDILPSAKSQFICAGCARSLKRELSVRRHASSGVRSFASHPVKSRQVESNQVRLVDRVQRYHKSSEHAAAVEYHKAPGSDGDFLSAPQDRYRNTLPSIRQRLKKWREERGHEDYLASGRGSQVQLPALNSIGGEEELPDKPIGEEQEDYYPDSPLEYQGDSSKSILDPGDAVEVVVKGTGSPVRNLCVYVRMVEGQCQYITSQGFWHVNVKWQLSSCKIKNFMSPEELAPIIPYMPSTAIYKETTGTMPLPVSTIGPLPMTVTAPIVKKLHQLRDATDAFQRRYALAFDGLYNTLADDNEVVDWKLDALVPKIFGFPLSELSGPGLLALDRFGEKRENGFYTWRYYGDLMGFWVRSKKEVQMKNRVTEWARRYQESAAKAAVGKDVKEELRKNPLSAFITKAHRLILKSRRIRSPTTIGLLGPSAENGEDGAVHAVDTGETLTEDDKAIVRYIFEITQMHPTFGPNEATSICSLMYRAIGAYPNLDLSVKVARLLLQELGAMSPWADPLMYTYHLRLPRLGLWHYQERLMNEAEASCKELNTLRDTVQHVRKDWGQMPVYCIDEFDAIEIDDGISIERDTHNPDRVWIHIHIANPAAYIGPDHPIAVAARDILSSTYTPSKKFSMMPRGFTENLASLRADRPVMTVSTLLQADGSVADVEMSLGMVHNIVKLTPSAVNQALGQPKDLATMVVGGERPVRDNQKVSETHPEALSDLRLMQRFLHSRFIQRWNDWPERERIQRDLNVIQTDAWTTFRDKDPAFSGQISHWKGDPVIVIEGDRFPRLGDRPEFLPLVDHAMLLAGESAAKWCKNREIPIIFHPAVPHPDYPVSRLNQLKATDFRIEPAAALSVTPQPHFVLGMWQYTRMTSPMRRYVDLVNQWQIQAYLDAVSSPPKDQKPSEPLDTLPFTRQKLDDIILEAKVRLPALRRTAKACTAHWVHQALFRAFHFKEAELPEVWDFRVVGPKDDSDPRSNSIGIWGYLSPFQANAELLRSEENWEKDLQRSQYLPVKIEIADAEYDKIFVKAVGPPSDTPTTTQPIHIQPLKKSASHGKNSEGARQS